MSKQVLVAPLIFLASIAQAGRYTFNYNTPDELKITVQADDRHSGYSKAAKLCYKILTKDVYPGAEAGLAIIDICVNPLNYKP